MAKAGIIVACGIERRSIEHLESSSSVEDSPQEPILAIILLRMIIAKSSSSHSSLHSVISPMKAKISPAARWSGASVTTSCEGEEKLATAPGGEELDQRPDAAGIVQTDYPN